VIRELERTVDPLFREAGIRWISGQVAGRGAALAHESPRAASLTGVLGRPAYKFAGSMLLKALPAGFGLQSVRANAAARSEQVRWLGG
jgi:hypothetical protein